MRRLLILVAIIVPAIAWLGRRWVTLAARALTYPTTARGSAANLAVHGGILFATLAEDGLAIYRIADGVRAGVIAPPPGSGSADDVAAADGLLFVLDARPPGALTVFDVANPAAPRRTAGPVAVPVGPFAGVSAANGLVIVSGGTSELTAWRYDRTGMLRGPFATADLGRGQPDALVSAHRPLAYVSTHYRGPRFGLDLVALEPGGIRRLSSVALPGAGFSRGGAHPANFPVEAAELSRDTLLVAHAGGLSLIHVADPARPRLLTTIDLGAPAISVDAHDGWALVSTTAGVGLVAIGPAPGRRLPARIVRTPAFAPGTGYQATALTQARAMVAAGDRGVLFMDR